MLFVVVVVVVIYIYIYIYIYILFFFFLFFFFIKQLFYLQQQKTALRKLMVECNDIFKGMLGAMSSITISSYIS